MEKCVRGTRPMTETGRSEACDRGKLGSGCFHRFVEGGDGLACQEGIQDMGIQVSVVGPADCAKFPIHVHPREVAAVLQRRENAAERRDLGQVHDPLDAVFEPYEQTILVQRADLYNILQHMVNMVTWFRLMASAVRRVAATGLWPSACLLPLHVHSGTMALPDLALPEPTRWSDCVR